MNAKVALGTKLTQVFHFLNLKNLLRKLNPSSYLAEKFNDLLCTDWQYRNTKVVDHE